MAGEFTNDAVMDAALDEIGNNCNQQTLCSAAPTTRTEAVTTFKLATVVMTPVTDFTKANGDTSGRKLTVAQKTGVTVDSNGTGTHVALVDGTRLLDVTALSASKPVTTADTLTFPAWDHEIGDPT